MRQEEGHVSSGRIEAPDTETRLEKANKVSRGIKSVTTDKKPSVDNTDERERVVDGS